MKKRIAFPGVVISISALLLVYSINNPVRKTTIIGPSSWPNFILIMLMILGAIEFARSLILRSENETQFHDNDKSAERIKRFSLLVFSIAAYIFLLPILGFFFSSYILFVYLTILFGVKRKKLMIFAGIIVPLFLGLLFCQILHISMPRGIGIFETFSRLIY